MTTYATDPTLLVPVLPTQDGPPDALAVAAWHLALSNLVGVEVPHDLLGLWLFPTRGGTVLLAPAELGQDKVDITAPDQRVTQDGLYELEQRVRGAGYGSVIAVPVRSSGRDLGLVLFAHLEPGRLGPTEAVRLHRLVRHLVPTFLSLAEAPPLALTAEAPAEVTLETAAEAVARAAAEGRTAPEALRLVGGVLHQIVPHEYLDVAVPAQPPGIWALLGGAPDDRRWRESATPVSQAMAALVARADPGGTLLIPDLRAAGLSWPSHRDARSIQRVHSVLGVRLSVAGAEDAWLLLAGQAPGIFREADVEVIRAIAPVIALRVHGLRAVQNAAVARAEVEGLRAGQGRAPRVAAMLAETAHWGDAMDAFVADVRASLGYRGVRFVLRLGEDRVVEQEAGDLRPLGALEACPLAGHRLEPILTGGAAHQVGGPEGEDLALPLRVAGRVAGAMELCGGPGESHPIQGARLFADLVAPHIELIRRTAATGPALRSADRPRTRA